MAILSPPSIAGPLYDCNMFITNVSLMKELKGHRDIGVDTQSNRGFLRLKRICNDRSNYINYEVEHTSVSCMKLITPSCVQIYTKWNHYSGH
jgi:hypothetical protein